MVDGGPEKFTSLKKEGVAPGRRAEGCLLEFGFALPRATGGKLDRSWREASMQSA
jgi:hypothetical protein